MNRIAARMFCLSHTSGRWLFPVALLALSTIVEAAPVHHDLHVKLEPARSEIIVRDRVQLPADVDAATFSLRSSLQVTSPDAQLEPAGSSGDGRLRYYQISRLPPGKKVQLDYRGKITTDAPQGVFEMPSSVFDAQGVFLDGKSAWLPRFDAYPWLEFRLHVEAPDDWEIISQGERSRDDGDFVFEMRKPQDDIYLLGGAYKRYAHTHDGIGIEVYLLKEDAALAQDYLQASAGYLDLYSEWIGRYPYARFAVVENRWQTGYGMPSFTLLGSRVIRLPFILHTSLPHEILHNWWGNGVFIDYSAGNWSEGLTAYLSDHYSNEQRGNGSAYRRKALERYANFAAQGRDFALRDFRARHDEASQAVGYSKSLMLIHMLRERSGDAQFDRNLRAFWERYQFSTATFPELVHALHPGADREQQAFIEQWLDRIGAPEIVLAAADMAATDNVHRLSLRVEQRQAGPVYRLSLPVVISFGDAAADIRKNLDLTGREQRFSIDFEQRPRSVALDPAYDVFRLLHPYERPSSLGRLFGAEKQVLVYPSAAQPALLQAWKQLAQAWSKRYGNVELVADNEFRSAPTGAAVWLLGWQNRLLPAQREHFTSPSQRLDQRRATFEQRVFGADDHAVVVLVPDNTATPCGFIGANDAGMILQLARKLPHYASYGALAFAKPDAENVLKLNLEVESSPMTIELD